jgi:aminoglycoside phosphotransferase (APT) family kinase protein
MPSLDPPGGVIPTVPEELTATWLAAILTRHGFSAAIEAMEFRPFEANPLTSEMLRVVPRFQDETTGVTPPLLWKRSTDDLERRAAFSRGYAGEVAFYREVAPRVDVSVPRCFAAAYDEGSGAHVLLLEDLTPARQGDFVAGVPPERAEAVLRELARLHATQWSESVAPPSPERFTRLRAFVEEWAPSSTPFLTEHVDQRAAERTRRYADEVADLFAALAAGPQALTHGDAHAANVLFPDSADARPYLVDWQGSGVDAPLRDVTRFLQLGLTIEDRRAHEDELLAGYLAQLDALGARYDGAAAARDYRTASMLQWGWAVVFFRHEPLWDRDTRAAMPVLVQRAAAAFDDAWAWFARR